MNVNSQNQKFPGFPPEPITNFWSYPKILNGYWHSLSSSEQKVLDYILRRTWGFDKTSDEISLSQLEKGIRNLDNGTGLSRPTIIKAIRGLVLKGFIKKSEGEKANCYELVKDFNYPSKESLLFAGKESLHTIDNITIDNKQYNSFSKKELAEAYKKGERKFKPYFWGNEMRWSQEKWWVIKNGEWLEFAGNESEIEWRQLPSHKLKVQ